MVTKAGRRASRADSATMDTERRSPPPSRFCPVDQLALSLPPSSHLISISPNRIVCLKLITVDSRARACAHQSESTPRVRGLPHFLSSSRLVTGGLPRSHTSPFLIILMNNIDIVNSIRFICFFQLVSL